MPAMDDWWAEALCAEIGGDFWWPEKGRLDTAQMAKRICHACPVTAECLAYALQNELDGVWGGTTPRERRKMKRNAA